MILDSAQIEYLCEILDPLMDEGDQLKIDEDIVHEAGEPDFEPLIGYTVSKEADGEHKNDYQVIDYTFKFRSPIGKITEIETQMSLVSGWSHAQDEEII